MNEWTFTDARILNFLFFAPLLALLVIAAKSVEFKKISSLGPGVFRHLAFRWSSSRFWFRTLLFVIGFSSIIVALAGPRYGYKIRELPHGGRDIMVLFDISRSMNANDVSPSRLDRAKRKLLDLITGLKGERVGIVPFAGRAFVHCPLTDDKNMLTLFVNSLEDSLISVQGTNLTEAVKIASESLEVGAAGDSTGKSLLVLTDGEDFSGDIEGVRSIITSKKLDLSVLGIGTPEGSPIPQKEGGLVKDRRGNLVISKLAENELMDLANSVGGLYVRSTAGDADINAILQKVTQRTEATEMGEEKVWNEYFQWFLFLGLIAILLGWLFTPYQAIVAIALCMISSFTYGDGFSLFKKKKYEEAALAFEKEASTQDQNFLSLYNAAVSHYEAMNYEAAILGFKRATEAKESSLRKDAFFNLANTLVAQDKLEESIAPYKEALSLDRSFTEAKENLEWVLKRLQQKEEEKKNQNQSQNSNQNSEKSQNNQSSSGEGQSSNQKNDSPSESGNKNSNPSKGEQQSSNQAPPSKEDSSKEKSPPTSQGQSSGASTPSDKMDQEKEASKEARTSKDDKTKEASASPPHEGQNLVPGQQVTGTEEAKALLRQVDENMKVWGVKPQFDENPAEKDW
jgi:Ca-activated chloride channel family protein